MTTKALHIVYVAIILIASICAYVSVRVWLDAHDASVLANQQAALASAVIKAKDAQIASLVQAASQQKQVIIKEVASVKTVPQAVITIPTLSNLPLNARAAIDNPAQVSVDAVSLAQELGDCDQARIDLNTCQQTAPLVQDKLAAKDEQIAQLKKKKSFWSRVKSTTKVGGIVLAVGIAIGAAL